MSSYQTYTVQYKMKRKVKSGETGAEVEVDFPQTETIDDPYAVLGVTSDTPKEDIKKAYRKLSRETHPDANQVPGATADQQTLNKAFEFLSDDGKKRALDRAVEAAQKLSGQVDKKPAQASSQAAPKPAHTVQREPQPTRTTRPPEQPRPAASSQPHRPRENRPPSRPFEGSPQRKQNPFVDNREKTDFPFEPSPRKQPPRENPFAEKNVPKKPEAPTPPGTPEQTAIFKQKRQSIDEATLGYQLPTAGDIKYAKVSEEQRSELTKLTLQKRVDIYAEAFKSATTRSAVEYTLGTLKYDLTGNLVTKEAHTRLIDQAQKRIYSFLLDEIKTAKNNYNLPTSFLLQQMLRNEEVTAEQLASLQTEIGNKTPNIKKG
jgi:curved DNA-binding protein CbpA